MKIVHVISGLNDGGAEAVLYRLCTYDDASHTHHVVSLMDKGKYGPLLEAKGVRVHCLNMPQGRVTASGLWRLGRLLRREKPDAVQTWMYHADLIGGVVARLAGVKRVFWNIRHTTLDERHSKRSTILIAKLCARLSPRIPTAIVCCAEKALQVHSGLGYAAEKLVVIPNGYDLNRLAVDEGAGKAVRHELGLPDDMSVLGMVARFNPQKDHPNLLRALAELNNRGVPFRCLLVGRDLDAGNPALGDLIASLGLRESVVLLGQRTDIPAVMNSLDVHVLSSADGEAFPNVVAEAMACGTPVVVTDVGDAGLIVGETGWVVPPRDHLKLADALQEALLLTRADRAAQGRLGRERIVNRFSIERMVAAYHALWAA